MTMPFSSSSDVESLVVVVYRRLSVPRRIYPLPHSESSGLVGQGVLFRRDFVHGTFELQVPRS
jgi:hypothetical protein